jgi:formylglycine-generating enzyme required for sulfatase activity
MGSRHGYKPSEVRCPDRAVENTSWNDVQEFLKKLNALDDGHQYRLPTEAEWEYAAWAGSSADPKPGFQQEWLNAWGLYEMGMWSLTEWCSDWYDED